MARLMRRCTKCGHTDERRTWGSMDEATKAGAFDGTWTCGSCAWTEFELVEADARTPEEARSGR